MTEPTAVLERTESDLDQLTADLFDLDIRAMQVPMACTNNTNDGCSASCPSVGCSATCSCTNCNCKK
ncbi:hypothetical protein ACFWEJ_07045 [Promicromonospora sp. NPDC060204]|uniref:hypothetical protein n=1 Tax=unclassified Promicromonospora TaxID=2647929 RepID=UPI0036611262